MKKIRKQTGNIVKNTQNGKFYVLETKVTANKVKRRYREIKSQVVLDHITSQLLKGEDDGKEPTPEGG